MDVIMAGEATQAQIAGFLVALRAKGETADEIAGCAEAMREHVLRVSPTRTDLVDIVGHRRRRREHVQHLDRRGARRRRRGRRRSRSTATARRRRRPERPTCSRRSASELELPPERIERSIDELGFGFLFAQAHHPAMRHAAPVRRELATRTVFNVLGPLDEPGGRARPRARRLLAGARTNARRRRSSSSRRRARTSSTARAASTSSRRAGRTSSARSTAGSVREYELDPLDLGIDRCDPEELRGGDPQTNAAALRDVLGGRRRRPSLGRDPQRGRRDRRRGACREPARGNRARRARRSTPAPLPRGSTSSWSSRSRCRHEVRGRARAARLRRDRRVQAPLAVGRRHPPRTRASRTSCRPTRRTARAPSPSSSTTRSPARSTTCGRRARRVGRCRCSRKGFFSTEEHLRERARGGRRRGAPHPARPRRRNRPRS